MKERWTTRRDWNCCNLGHERHLRCGRGRKAPHGGGTAPRRPGCEQRAERKLAHWCAVEASRIAFIVLAVISFHLLIHVVRACR